MTIKSPHITNSVVRLCKYFKVKSHKFKNWPKSPDGALYIHTTAIEKCSTLIWAAHASKIFTLQNWEVVFATVLFKLHFKCLWLTKPVRPEEVHAWKIMWHYLSPSNYI
jgi:hypothetical protein